MVEDHQLPEGLREAPLRERGGKTFMGGGRLATRSRYVVLAGLLSIFVGGGFHFLAQRAIGASEAELTSARTLAAEIEEIEKTYWQVRGEERGFLLSAEQRHVDRYQTVSTALTTRLDALFANPAAVSIFGAKTEADLIGMPVSNLVHPEFHPQLQDRMRLLESSTGGLPSIEFKLVGFDGQPFDIEATGTNIVFGREPAVQSIFKDI